MAISPTRDTTFPLWKHTLKEQNKISFVTNNPTSALESEVNPLVSIGHIGDYSVITSTSQKDVLYLY